MADKTGASRQRRYYLKTYTGTPEKKIRGLIKSARDRAKKTGIEFAITEADIHLTTHCPVFGTPFEWANSKRSDTSPSLDRIDNTQGYVPGNVWLVSARANIIKRDATLPELKQIVAALETKGEEG